jgi:hypothetical protein
MKPECVSFSCVRYRFMLLVCDIAVRYGYWLHVPAPAPASMVVRERQLGNVLMIMFQVQIQGNKSP